MHFQRMAAKGLPLMRVQVSLARRSRVWMLLIKENESWKVDREAFTNASGVRRAAFLPEALGTLIELPLLVARKPAANAYTIVAGASPDNSDALVL